MVESGLLGLGRIAPPRPPGLGLPLEIGRGPPNLPLGWPPASLPSRRQTMSTEDDPKKVREDDAQATPEWHRARARLYARAASLRWHKSTNRSRR